MLLTANRPKPGVHRRLRTRLIIGVWAAALSAGKAATAGDAAPATPLALVASIAPFQSLAASVAGDRAVTALLIQGTRSAHSYALRPSDMTLLERADLVIWGGPALETFLVKPLATLGKADRALALAADPGIAPLPRRAGRADHDHGPDHPPEPAPGQAGADALGRDPHFWLDPTLAGRAVARIRDALIAADPAGEAIYRRNAAAADTSLQALDAELRARFAPVRARPFVVYHDAYQYLERRYGLNAVGTITNASAGAPSAKRLRALSGDAVSDGVGCVVSEPQFSEALPAALAADWGAAIRILDPIGPGGTSIAPYVTTMRRLADALAACLALRPAGRDAGR